MNIHTFSYWVLKHHRAYHPSGGIAVVDVKGTSPPDSVTITFPNGVVFSCLANLPLISQLIHLA